MRETVPGNPVDRPDGDVRLAVAGRLDLRQVLGIHQRGQGDPAMRFEVSGSCWRASRTPEGPVTLFVEAFAGAGVREGGTAGEGVRDGHARVRAWGPGSAWALAQAPALLGLDDLHRTVTPAHPAVAAAQRKVREVRIGRTGRVLEALVPAILEQKVTGDEARRAYRGLVARWGEDAPGPPGLRVLPAPEVIARLPYHALHPVGVERRRAQLLVAVCRDADRLERLGAAATRTGAAEDVRGAAYDALRAYPGIGPWTAAEVGMRAFGDPDAVSVGDFHVPNMVAWALAREPRGTDARMLELLEPYRGQRGRVVRLLELAGIKAPRYGPRFSPRRIGDL